MSTAAQLTADNVDDAWDDADSNTLGAWDFGTDSQPPALKYANYDGDGIDFDCDQFPAGACDTLLPGQRIVIVDNRPPGHSSPRPGTTIILTASIRHRTLESWTWRQRAGVTVSLGGAATAAPTFTMPNTRAPLVFELTARDSDGRFFSAITTLAVAADADGNGLIEIYSLLDLHNMRYNLAGTSYETSDVPVENSSGCPAQDEGGCRGYELMRDLDFDGNGDGSTWSRLAGDSGYILDPEDNRDDYFPVARDGTGGWEPIGSETDPFTAVFDGNGRRIRNLAIRRAQQDIGLFGAIDGEAAIRNFGLINNLAEYTGSGAGVTYIGGLVGWQHTGSITVSYATGPASGGNGGEDWVGGLVGYQAAGSITASYATGIADGRNGANNRVGGLVGLQDNGLILASYATGAAAAGDGNEDLVGGLVGQQRGGSIRTSYATGAAAGGDGDTNRVGGLVGNQAGGVITASYATGAADGGAGGGDHVGGLVGRQFAGEITASYATGAAAAGTGGDDANNRPDAAGRLVGFKGGMITASYGFGEASGGSPGLDGTAKPAGVEEATQLTALNAGDTWDDADSNTQDAWDFGTDIQLPALKYADYDGDGTAFNCVQLSAGFPVDVCGTLLPGQEGVSIDEPPATPPGGMVTLAVSVKRLTIESWDWQQLAGVEVSLRDANTATPTFTRPNTRAPLVFKLTAKDSDGRDFSARITVVAAADADGNGLIEIYNLLDLHNMRYDLAGTSYRTSTASVRNRSGCPAAGCRGYELMQDLDFDHDDDGSTWSRLADGSGYTLDEDDSQADYFPVANDGAGGWLGGWEPIGHGTYTFVAAFVGNGHSISNLAIRRDQQDIGLFGAIGSGAAIGSLGLIDNLADYTGSSDENYIGGLVGQMEGGSITASYATGPVDGGNGAKDSVGGLVGWQEGGVITASYATGLADGGDGADDRVGGLVGYQEGGSIRASYATGAADGGSGIGNRVGGLVGVQFGGSITASYATGRAVGGNGIGDNRVGGLVGFQEEGGVITASYGFGEASGDLPGTDGSDKPAGVKVAAQLTAANAGSSWDGASSNTLGAWDFGTDNLLPALNYADYDGEGPAFDCVQLSTGFPAGACGTLLPGQEGVGVRQAPGSPAPRPGATIILTALIRGLTIEFWDWQQRAGVTVSLMADDTATPTFTMPNTRAPLLFELTARDVGGRDFRAISTLTVAADVDGNGLIEIYSLLDLHNMRYNLYGTSYETSDVPVGNRSGCPGARCRGYELMQDLDFDGDGDGKTWSRSADDLGYILHTKDNQADYFPVTSGGWLPIGSFTKPFTAVFDGNGHSIRNLAIRRAQQYIGLFGAIGGEAAIGNLGLIDNLADYTGRSAFTYIGGLVGAQAGGSITASYATGPVASGEGGTENAGGLVGWQSGGSITASYATGTADGRNGNGDRAGGLVGLQSGGSITASYATGAATVGNGTGGIAGGLVGYQTGGSITASYATGAAASGDGDSDSVGGLVGGQKGGSITASYATGAVDGGSGNMDYVGGLVGLQSGGSITASYATGPADGGSGDLDSVGGLVGLQDGDSSITASYSFGAVVGEGTSGLAGDAYPEGVEVATQLTADNVDDVWDDADSNTLGAWDFGTDSQPPALKYANYDGDGIDFDCDQFSAGACDTLLPGQRIEIVDNRPPGHSSPRPGTTIILTASILHRTLESWSWQQRAGVTVSLMGANTATPTFTMPVTRSPLVFNLTATTAVGGTEYSARITLVAAADADGNGLIEIYSLLDLHNMRYDLAGTSYKTNTASVGNSSGCPDSICRGYELMQDLDFNVDGGGDGDGDGDGSTWSRLADDSGYTLDSDDNQADYFPVAADGTGGWLPVGHATESFVAAFDGNGHSILNLAIRRNQEYIGLFGLIGSGAVIGNLGLIDNLADYTGSDNNFTYIGGLVGWQHTGSITASYATGPAAGGGGNNDYVGGLVGYQSGGSITASYATGPAAGEDGNVDHVGGLVGGRIGGSITASYATGIADGGDGSFDNVGGLVGNQAGGSIRASYATGAADGGNDDRDVVGGLVGYRSGGSITASYATGAADGGDGSSDNVGGLVGLQDGGPITASYGFSSANGEIETDGTDGSAKPQGVSTAAQLTADNVGEAWNDADKKTLGAWDFGIDGQFPVLNYADYDGEGLVFSCNQLSAGFPAGACGTLLPGQERSLVFSPSPLSLVEGEEGSYTLVLISQPASSVVVRLSVGGDEGAIRLQDADGDPVSELSFDAMNWNQTQTVRVLTKNDDYSNGRRMARISHEIETSDPDYPGVAFTPVVEVRIEDNDPVPGVMLVLEDPVMPHVPVVRHDEGSPADGADLERELQLVVRAVLDGPMRSAATTLTLSFGAAGDSAKAAGDDVDYRILSSSLELVIAPLAQQSEGLDFSLFLIQDELDEDDEFFTVTAEAEPALTTTAAVFTIVDDDEAGVVVGLRPQNLREGDVLSWEVVLTSQPTEDVFVTVRAVSPVVSDASADDLTFAPNPETTSLKFTPENWNTSQRLMITVALELMMFGELTIVHEVSSSDPNYQDFPVPLVTLELTDVNVSLQVLILRLAAGGDPLPLVGAPDAPAVEGFDPDVLEYRAEVSSDAGEVFITATPAVTEDLLDDQGDTVQRKAEVRLFRRLASGNVPLGDDVAAGSDTPVNLPLNEDEFVLLAEVSVPSQEGNGEPTYQTYTLTLTRALPAAAELVIFLASPGDSEEKRQTPLTADTPVEFAAADESMELIFVVRDGDDDSTSYGIKEVNPVGLVADNRLVVEDIRKETETNGDSATRVTLRRNSQMAGTFTFNLSFTATPERPLAVNAEDLSAAIAVVLLDNTDTKTQFRVTWRGHDQEMDLPLPLPLAPDLNPALRVSDNGTLTIALRVERSGGGVRSFEQSNFTLSVTSTPPASEPRVKLNGNILEIGVGDGSDLAIEITAAADETLDGGINVPDPLRFSVAFEQPRAEIRAVAVAAPAPLAFGTPLFVFVGEDRRLPLELVLAEDSVPLANSDRILHALSLTVTSAPVDLVPTTVTLEEPSDSGASPGRVLLFNVAAAQNDVSLRSCSCSWRAERTGGSRSPELWRALPVAGARAGGQVPQRQRRGLCRGRQHGRDCPEG